MSLFHHMQILQNQVTEDQDTTGTIQDQPLFWCVADIRQQQIQKHSGCNHVLA